MKNEFLSIKDIFEKYKNINVPYYQRDYVWGSKNDGRNLYKFIDDIFNQYNENPSSNYFIGTLAFCSNEVNDVIDGQQRITSIVLILTILSNMKCSEEVKNKNNKLIMPNDKFVLLEDNYLSEELKYNLNLPNNFNTQGYSVDISKTVDRIKKQIEIAWDDKTENWYDGLYDYILNNVKFISLEYSNISDSLKYFLNINSLSIQLTQSDIFFSILSQSLRIIKSTENIFIIKQRINELSNYQGLNKDIDGYKVYDIEDNKGLVNIIYIFLNAYYQNDKDIMELDNTGIGKWMSYYKNDVFNDQLIAKEFVDNFLDYLKDFEYIYKLFTNYDSKVDIKSSLYTSFVLLKYENYFDLIEMLKNLFKIRHNYIKGSDNLYNLNEKNISTDKINAIAKRLNLTILANYIRSSNKRLDSYITNISLDGNDEYKRSIDEIVVDMDFNGIFNLNYNDKKNVSNVKIKDESRIIKVIFALQESFLNNTAKEENDFNDYFKDILLTNNFTIEHIYSIKEYHDKTRLKNWQDKKNKFINDYDFDTERFRFENLSLLDNNINSSCRDDEIKDKLVKYKSAKKIDGSEWEYLILSLVDDSEYYRNENIKKLGIPERKLINIDQNTWELSENNRDFNTFLLKLSIKLIANK